MASNILLSHPRLTTSPANAHQRPSPRLQTASNAPLLNGERQKKEEARTTEEGLKALNEIKGRLKVSWDEMVIEAVSARYSLDKAMMSLPKKDRPAKAAETGPQQPAEQTTGERPTETQETRPQPKKKGKEKGTNQAKVEA